MPRRENPHKDKLEEIRENIKRDHEAWDPIYKDGEKSVKFLTDPWEDNDRRTREDAGRPVVTFDELGQYLNQAQNEVRMNPRSPKFSPEAEGANEDTARVYGNAYRRAEYRSNAQEAYTTAYDNALTRGFSFVRMKLEFEHPRSFFQHYQIDPVPNPNSCLPDSDNVKADGAGWKRFTFLEKYSKAEFKRKFKNAEFTTFSSEQIAEVGSQWMGENHVYVAEYWEVEEVEKTLTEWFVPATRRSPERYVSLIQGERRPRGAVKVQERVTTINKVRSCFTNGVEILETNGQDWHDYVGSMIPFAPCYGRIVWVNAGAGAERKILSMVSLAREPYAAFCFLAACELEAIGTITKNPYWAYEGQLDPAQKNRIKQSLHEPVAVLEAKARLEGLPGVLLPLPERNPMSVDLSAYAMAKEEARRSIQAAMGWTPLPSQAQRRNEKSGVALKQIEESGQKGSYHFVDHYNDLLRRCAVIFEDGFDKINDTEREIITLEADKNVKRVFLGGGKTERPEGLAKEVDFLPSLKGSHAVTIDVGPEFESEREEAGTFLDNFIGSPLFAALDPQKRDKMLALAVKIRMLGPMGDKMAEIIDPQAKGEMPPAEELMAMLQQAQQQIIPALEQEIAKLQQEKAAKVAETEGRMVIESKKAATAIQIKQMDVEQKMGDTSADNETAVLIQQMKNDIEMLKLKLTAATTGAELEQRTDAEGRDRDAAAVEGDKSREAASREGEANRAAKAHEGRESRAAAAAEGDKARAATAAEGEANRKAAEKAGKADK